MSACGPSPNSSIAFALKAGMSSGRRLVTRPWSTWTCSSTHVPPALRTSVCSDGNEVIVRPFTMPASTSTHGAWQIAAIGLCASAKPAVKRTAPSSARRKSPFATPPGISRPS